ncbi:MAG TPA: Lon-like protease helical domain-containing protein [Methylomirabilota bacterium]|nr:Lon-like protease helical domain-containing protein [Methylomirabilota bacterium]
MTDRNQARELAAGDLRRRFDPADFDFSSTADLAELEKVIGQERAVRALTFGLDIPSPGYHSYALGPVGTGKSTVINRLLKRQAARRPVPDDWCYVNNFDDTERPRALRLPAGRGCELRDAMNKLVDELQVEVPRGFEAEERERLEASLRELARKSKAFNNPDRASPAAT